MSKHGVHGSPYSPEEDQLIRDLYPTTVTKEMEKILPRRNQESIRTRAARIGVSKAKKRMVVTGKVETAFCRRGHPRDADNTYRMTSGKIICRACRRKKLKAFLAEHPGYGTKASVAWHRKRVIIAKKIVIDAKNMPCADCGQSYPSYVMDFDHVNGDKVDNIGWMKHRYPLSRLREEIAKCEVVCANCHRIRCYAKKAESPEQLRSEDLIGHLIDLE